MTGFVLAIALMAGAGYFIAQQLITQFTAPPPKPIFPNDKPTKPKPVAAKPQPATPKPEVSPSASPVAASAPAASPKPSPVAEGYRARVTLAEGLNLRESPSRDSARVGGVAFNERITVLEESPDKEWQRVRLESSGKEGWIRAGFAERQN